MSLLVQSNHHPKEKCGANMKHYRGGNEACSFDSSSNDSLTDKLAKVCHETLLPQGDLAHVPACLCREPEAKKWAVPEHALS